MRKLGVSLVLLAFGAAGIAAGPAAAQIRNGNFDLQVPSNQAANGWISADIDSSGGWRDVGGSRGGVYILNAAGLVITDPMVGQVLTGLTAGHIYEISGEYASWYYNSRPLLVPSFIAKVDSQTTFIGESGELREWREFSFVFVATSTTATVTFQGEAFGTDNDFAVDNISMRTLECAPCPADYDLDGSITMADLSAFFRQWQEGDACADVDGDGGVGAADLWSFLDLFQAGGC